MVRTLVRRLAWLKGLREWFRRAIGVFRFLQTKKDVRIVHVCKRPQDIFHYTSISALRGILGTNTLWATRATHLNDSSEMKVLWPRVGKPILECYEQELNRFRQRHPDFEVGMHHMGGVSQIARFDAKTMVDDWRSRLLDEGARPSPMTPFVASFTNHNVGSPRDAYHRNHGMLSQWRAYAGNEGVMIVFDRREITRLVQKERELSEHWLCRISDVVYDEADMDPEEHFPEPFRLVRAFVRGWIHENENVEHLHMLLTKVLIELAWASARLKHGAFEEEQECRIVVGVNAALHGAEGQSVSAGQPESAAEIHYRPGHCGSIPFVRLFESCDEILPIKRIIVGPSRNQAAHTETVRELAKTRGIEVQTSETPYVGSA